MPPASPEEFRARHSRAISRLYTLARGRRWSLAEADFGTALQRSQAAHFRSASAVGRREVERYLESLELTDLALAAACRRDIPHAWQTLHADYLPVLHEAARATLREPEGAHRAAELLISELHGKHGEILDQYHGRSRLKTWLRALVARLHDAEIRSPGRIALDGEAAAAWFAAWGEALAALDPSDRLRLALYTLERLPLASITSLTGETRSRTVHRLRAAAAALHLDVARRLAEDGTLDRRQIRRLEEEAAAAVRDGDSRTPTEGFVAVALDRRLNAPGRQCPPPATLASLAEGRLGEAERTAAMLHASSCRGCIRQIGVLCRLERPGLAADELHLRRGASSRRTIAVAAVLAVAIGAAVTWMALRLPAGDGRLTAVSGLWRDGESEAPGRDVVPATLDERASLPTPSADDASNLPTPIAREPEPPDASVAVAELVDPPIPRAGTTPIATPAQEPASGARREATAPPAARTASSSGAATRAPSPTSPPTASPTATATVVPTATAIPTATAVPTATRPPVPTPPPTAAPARFPGDQPGATTIVSSTGTPAVRWWIAANGAIAHTRDGAGSWKTLRSGVDADLLAGAATGDRVAWVVGREGTVLRTTDGVSFRRLASPTRDDVVAVSARDAASATITTRRGERFTTDDGGATWRRL